MKRFAKWQIQKHFVEEKIFQWVDNARLILRKNSTVASGNYYLGLLEYAEMIFFLRYIRSHDVVCDVGANIGDYSILAAKCCGARAYAFEPIPSTYSFMNQQILLNEVGEKVRGYCVALSDACGKIYFTDEDAVSHAVSEMDGKIEAEMSTLDALNINDITFMKVDVEGFELSVLRGAAKALDNKNLNVVMAEYNGNDEKNKAKEKDNIISYMHEYGFVPFLYEPDNGLVPYRNQKVNNLIFIRDLLQVKDRLNTAGLHRVNDFLF